MLVLSLITFRSVYRRMLGLPVGESKMPWSRTNNNARCAVEASNRTRSTYTHSNIALVGRLNRSVIQQI